MSLTVCALSPNTSVDSFDEATESVNKKRKVEEAGGETATIAIPNEALYLIFSELNFKDLVAVGGVCFRWRQVAGQAALWNLEPVVGRYPDLDIVDGAIFQTEDVRDYIFNTLIPALDRMAKLKILGNAGFSIVSVDRKSANQLAAPGGFNLVTRMVTSRIGDAEVTGTWVIANSGLEETGNMTSDEQQKHVQGLGCEMVELVPVMAMTLAQEKLLFGDEPLVYIRLKNSFPSRVGEKMSVIFGGANEKGPNIRALSSSDKIPHFYAGAMIKI